VCRIAGRRSWLQSAGCRCRRRVTFARGTRRRGSQPVHTELASLACHGPPPSLCFSPLPAPAERACPSPRPRTGQRWRAPSASRWRRTASPSSRLARSGRERATSTSWWTRAAWPRGRGSPRTGVTCTSATERRTRSSISLPASTRCASRPATATTRPSISPMRSRSRGRAGRDRRGHRDRRGDRPGAVGGNPHRGSVVATWAMQCALRG
jgi:hypothetical protein